jgi:hypothetical protein
MYQVAKIQSKYWKSIDVQACLPIDRKHCNTLQAILYTNVGSLVDIELTANPDQYRVAYLPGKLAY